MCCAQYIAKVSKCLIPAKSASKPATEPLSGEGVTFHLWVKAFSPIRWLRVEWFRLFRLGNG